MKVLKALEKILPLIFWLILVFAFDTPRFATLTLIAAVLHELGHAAFGASRGFVRLIPSPHPTGFRINPANFLSYNDELILLIGGPVSNFCFFILGFLIYKATGGALFFDFAFLNLLTALCNLLPIRDYDGYRIIEVLILLRAENAFPKIKLLSALSFAFTSSLCFLSLYLLLKIGEGYWIFAVFFSSVLFDAKKLAEKNDF